MIGATPTGTWFRHPTEPIFMLMAEPLDGWIESSEAEVAQAHADVSQRLASCRAERALAALSVRRDEMLAAGFTQAQVDLLLR